MAAQQEFLSDAWFDQLEELIEQHGELQLPSKIAALCINFEVEESDAPKKFALKGGLFHRTPVSDAATTVCVDDASALKMALIDQDPSDLIERFMTGRVRVQGDITQLMAAQSFKPTAQHKALLEQVKAFTLP